MRTWVARAAAVVPLLSGAVAGALIDQAWAVLAGPRALERMAADDLRAVVSVAPAGG